MDKKCEDLMIDERFIAFMNGEKGAEELFWNAFPNQDKSFLSELEKAKTLYTVLTLHKQHTVSDIEKVSATSHLLKSIDDLESKNKPNKRIFPKNIPWIAASIILFIGIAISLAYVFKSSQSKSEGMYTEIIVPSGEKTQIKLSDGSKVWLNSESRLIYPTSFNVTNREVQLEGEGYFDIHKKENGALFTVNTQGVKVVALGTVFNVKSYSNENRIETTLIEGSVKFTNIKTGNNSNEIVLKPDQKLVYTKPLKTSHIEEGGGVTAGSASGAQIKSQGSAVIEHVVNTSNIVCWKDHLLIFDNETLEEIALKMSRWYNINVEITDEELKEQRFTGKFIYNESVKKVLEAINLTNPVHYKVVKNNVYISKTN